jgi:hypothetical protein
MTFEDLLNDRALDAFATAVNQTHLEESSAVRRMDVLLDNRTHVTRLKGVEIERAFDRDLVRHAATPLRCRWR